MIAPSIDDLRLSLGGLETSPAYVAKMMHPLPPAPVVERERYVCERAAGKRVLDVGASGDLHALLVGVAARVDGIDRTDGDGVTGFDLDDVNQLLLPVTGDYDLVVCGEVLEHLSNPGWFLTRLRRQCPDTPVLITTPNAFCRGGSNWLRKGIENVNVDHVAYYSYRTLLTLLTRHGYTVTEWAWYKGTPGLSEGLIALAE